MRPSWRQGARLSECSVTGKLCTCRHSSPYRSTSQKEKLKGCKTESQNAPSMRAGIFLWHSEGYNRGLLTVSLVCWMEVFIWALRRRDRNSQRENNMKQPSAGRRAPELDSAILDQEPLLILEPFQRALSLIKGSNPLQSENGKLLYQLHRNGIKDLSSVFADLLVRRDLEHSCLSFLGNMLAWVFIFSQVADFTFPFETLQMVRFWNVRSSPTSEDLDVLSLYIYFYMFFIQHATWKQICNLSAGFIYEWHPKKAKNLHQNLFQTFIPA